MGKTSSLKTILEQIKLLQKDKKIRLVITMAAVLLSAFIQAWAIQVFVRPAEIISGGFSGAAMLIERVGSLKGLTIPMQVTMILLNIPVALMCCRGISVRFTVVSLLQVVFGSIFLQIFSFQPIFTDEILNVIFGGVIYGTSIVIALRGNASTGGTDFIALYVSNKTGKSIWSYVFFGNALMYCVYGVIFGWKFAGYSIIFQFASTQMIHMLHTAYKKETLFIVTDRPDDVYKEIQQLIVSERKKQKVTQKELAHRTGLSQANISNIENGVTRPTIDSLQKIAEALGKRLLVCFEESEDI